MVCRLVMAVQMILIVITRNNNTALLRFLPTSQAFDGSHYGSDAYYECQHGSVLVMTVRLVLECVMSI